MIAAGDSLNLLVDQWVTIAISNLKALLAIGHYHYHHWDFWRAIDGERDQHSDAFTSINSIANSIHHEVSINRASWRPTATAHRRTWTSQRS